MYGRTAVRPYDHGSPGFPESTGTVGTAAVSGSATESSAAAGGSSSATFGTVARIYSSYACIIFCKQQINFGRVKFW